MILSLDFSSETPIYMQIRNQIMLGIAEGKLKPGEKLPSIRMLADESGVNMMTVNKAYQLLKQEGIIAIDRRSGAIVSSVNNNKTEAITKLSAELKLVISEAKLKGIDKAEMRDLLDCLYEEMEGGK